jgi:5-methylcytosine-specific restriction enzyme A
MPSSPVRECTHPGCHVLVSKGKCSVHAKSERRQYDANRAHDPRHTFYSSKRWRAARAQQLAAEPLCRTCQAEGRIKAATIADHITPIAQGGDPFGELQSLCWSCHSRKSVKEGSRYGQRG